jgi:general secretion pathway protein G
MVERPHRGEVRGGFTLMEVLVVVAIIVLLAAVAVPMVTGRLEDARRSRALLDCKAWTTAAESYYIKYGSYPANLETLCQRGPNGEDPYMEAKNLTDPWNRQYQYAYPPQHNTMTGKPDIWSGGRSGNEQIGNWLDKV